MAVTFQQLIERLDNVKPNGIDSVTARCPGHDDQRNSLVVTLAEDGKILINCKAGCPVDHVVQSMGLKLNDLFPKKEKSAAQAQYVNSYDYHDESGEVVMVVKRTRSKEFHPFVRVGSDGWRCGLNAGKYGTFDGENWFKSKPGKSYREVKNFPEFNPPLYNLPAILAEKGGTVFWVEGEKDAESSIKLGMTATTTFGGANRSFEPSYAKYFSDTDVIIIPDNDDAGRKYAAVVASGLAGFARSIRIANLKSVWPDAPEKSDISDLINKFNIETIDHPLILQLIDSARDSADVPVVQPASEVDTHPHAYIASQIPGFAIRNNCLCMMRDDEPRTLMTGSVIISEVISNDDGDTQTISFKFEAYTESLIRLPPAVIPADQAANLQLEKHWGVDINIFPGKSVREYIYFYCKQSGKITNNRTTVLAYTGWKTIEGKPVYLYHGGSVGSDTILVELESEQLRQYHLPDTGPDLLSAFDDTFKVLDAHDNTVTAPLLCLTFLAPLKKILADIGIDPNFVTVLVGPTQAGKTTIASLFLNFFGSFSRTTPPASFISTSNSLGVIMNLIGDAVLLIDDFYPPGNHIEKRRMNETFQIITRAAGDGANKSRLKSSMQLQKSRHPRCLIVITAEDLPDVSQSGIGRMFTVDVAKQDVPSDLTPHQNAATTGSFRKVMRRYIEYLADRWDELPKLLSEQYRQFYGLAVKKCGGTGRLPETVAWLLLGGWMLCRFATDSGFLTDESSQEIMGMFIENITVSSDSQNLRVNNENPTTQFVQALKDLSLRPGLFTVLNTRQEDPTLSEDSIGWYDAKFYHLSLGLTYGAIVNHYKSQGREFPISKPALKKRLEAEFEGAEYKKLRLGPHKTSWVLSIPRGVIDDE